MSILQPIEELEEFYQQNDPWQYETTLDDKKRKDIILSEIPPRNYKKVLDVGCGQGFITKDLPGSQILGVDISSNAINRTQVYQNDKTKFIQSSIFELLQKAQDKYDLIVITGVMYPQYIGDAHKLVYRIIDHLLVDDGILLCCHIEQWYKARFPYLMLEYCFFNYREYIQRLEVYVK